MLVHVCLTLVLVFDHVIIIGTTCDLYCEISFDDDGQKDIHLLIIYIVVFGYLCEDHEDMSINNLRNNFEERNL